MRKVYVQPDLEVKMFQVEDIITASADTPTTLLKTLDLTSDAAWVADDSVIDFDFN